MNSESTHVTFPAYANFDATGKPLLSWRVHVLPYLEEQKLYGEFHLNEPWDSEHNKKLLERLPSAYRHPRSAETSTKTRFLAPLGADYFMTGTAQGIKIASIKDGTARTINLLEVPETAAVEWTKPDDWRFDPKKDKPPFAESGDLAVCFVDGSVHFLPRDIDPKVFGALLTRSGGEKIPDLPYLR